MQPAATAHGGELIPIARSSAVTSSVPQPSTSGAAKSLYVGNLSCFVTEVTLHDIFSTLGKIAECKVIKDKQTGLPAGYAFVRFEDHRYVLPLSSQEMSALTELRNSLKFLPSVRLKHKKLYACLSGFCTLLVAVA